MLFEEYIYILALEMASPGNQHCVSCIGALSFPIEFFSTIYSQLMGENGRIGLELTQIVT